MLLVKRNSTNPLERTFSSLVNDFFNDEDMFSFSKFSNNLNTNIRENDTSYFLDIQVPGLSKEDITINLEDNMIKISSKKENIDENDRFYQKQFSVSSFEKSFTIPDDVNEDDITAKVENGILTITLLKNEKAKITKNIEIK
jgi:HSP20 family protein